MCHIKVLNTEYKKNSKITQVRALKDSNQARTQISILDSKFILYSGFPLWQSQHSQSSVHFKPALKHSQYFFWHSDFLQVHLRAGTQEGTPLKQLGWRQLTMLLALVIQSALAMVLWQQTHTQFSLHVFPLAKHSQYSFRQSILVHLQPACERCLGDKLSQKMRLAPASYRFSSSILELSSSSRQNRSLARCLLIILCSMVSGRRNFSEPDEEDDGLDLDFKFQQSIIIYKETQQCRMCILICSTQFANLLLEIPTLYISQLHLKPCSRYFPSSQHWLT